MPQFDKITFFNQIFWVFILFVFFYLTFLRLSLPKIAAVLKARLKKLIKYHILPENSSLEIESIVVKSNQKLKRTTDIFRLALIKNIENSERWLNLEERKSNLSYKKMQSLYLNFFGQIITKKTILPFS